MRANVLCADQVLQITDLHLKRSPTSTLLGFDTAATLEMVLEKALSEAKPSAILVTGDIAHDEHIETYYRYLNIMAAYYTGPILSLPGNHDQSHYFKSPVETEAVTIGNWLFAGLDSHADGQVAADVSAEDLRALRECLDKHPDKYVIIATHHPPVSIGCSWLDSHRIKIDAELIGLLEDYPLVKGIVFGHIHQPIDVMFEGVRLLGAPSTCFQFSPNSTSFSIDRKPPGYRWLTLMDDGLLETEVGRLKVHPYEIDISDK